MKKYLFFSVVILLTIVITLWKRCHDLSQENSRISTNFESVNRDLEVLQNEYGEKCATIMTLTLKKDELEKANKSYLEQLDKMNIKKSEVKTIIQTETVVKIDTVLVVRNDSCLEYKTEDTFVEVCGRNIVVEMTTEADIALYERRKYKFLWFRIGKKEKWAKIMLSNEHINLSTFRVANIQN
jgi:3D (Asp-Asp-Asp) domain-containing protein